MGFFSKFFKSSEEKEITMQMEREEQLQIFNEQINEIKKKRSEYAKIAAEAELNGDTATYEVAVNSLIELTNIVSSLVQTKANFDLINISNAVSQNMTMAFNALEKMSDCKANLPDIKKIQKANYKISRYMKEIKISGKTMAGVMKRSNPANTGRSKEEIDLVRPMVDAEISKIIGNGMAGLSGGTKVGNPATEQSNFDLSSEIEKERNRII